MNTEEMRGWLQHLRVDHTTMTLDCLMWSWDRVMEIGWLKDIPHALLYCLHLTLCKILKPLFAEPHDPGDVGVTSGRGSGGRGFYPISVLLLPIPART